MTNATITIDMEVEGRVSSMFSAMPSFRETQIRMSVKGKGLPTATDCSKLLRLWTRKTNTNANAAPGDIEPRVR